MEEREKKIRLWFDMWLKKQDLGMDGLFAEHAVYTESWGPQYQGLAKIRHWFEEWNTRGDVQVWDIKRFFHSGSWTAVEWYFKNRMYDGTVEAFDGISLIEWTTGGRIRSLKEFGCNTGTYDPYENGPAPQFRDGQALWF